MPERTRRVQIVAPRSRRAGRVARAPPWHRSRDQAERVLDLLHLRVGLLALAFTLEASCLRSGGRASGAPAIAPHLKLDGELPPQVPPLRAPSATKRQAERALLAWVSATPAGVDAPERPRRRSPRRRPRARRAPGRRASRGCARRSARRQSAASRGGGAGQAAGQAGRARRAAVQRSQRCTTLHVTRRRYIFYSGVPGALCGRVCVAAKPILSLSARSPLSVPRSQFTAKWQSRSTCAWSSARARRAARAPSENSGLSGCRRRAPLRRRRRRRRVRGGGPRASRPER